MSPSFVARTTSSKDILPPSTYYYEEDNLLQGINSYRQSLNMPALSKNDKAGYLADEIANQLEHQPCMTTTSPITTAPSSRPQITNFPDLLEKCNIDINTTRDGVIYCLFVFPSSFQLWSSQTTRNPSFQGMSITPSTPELA
ncbi:putative GPI-anchored protein [Camellia lanceoleosa]|uniref:GPI-anchored protein n=1 Tax=Camellia lanceoleosa TaxID=1840588 RepID=A0ACC0ISN1_9ERIC|nr:putative GPI-anchored protein [Camellia lanceoleosa]